MAMNFTSWVVIVVEDTYDDQMYVARVLQHYGAQVHVVADGDECLRLLQRVEPTVVITDLAMPRRDGWQTLVAMRSNVATAHIPVVAITAYHSVDVAQDVMRAGFDGYFAKPLHPQTFVQRLQEIIAV